MLGEFWYNGRFGGLYHVREEFWYNGTEVCTILGEFWYNDMDACAMLGDVLVQWY